MNGTKEHIKPRKNVRDDLIIISKKLGQMHYHFSSSKNIGITDLCGIQFYESRNLTSVSEPKSLGECENVVQ